PAPSRPSPRSSTSSRACRSSTPLGLGPSWAGRRGSPPSMPSRRSSTASVGAPAGRPRRSRRTRPRAAPPRWRRGWARRTDPELAAEYLLLQVVVEDMEAPTTDPRHLELGLDTFGDVTVDLDGRRVPQDQVIRDVVEEAVLAD